MSAIEFPGEAMVRKAGGPPQPKGTRWYTDCGNAAGTAHLYTTERDGLLVSHCGRAICSVIARKRAPPWGNASAA